MLKKIELDWLKPSKMYSPSDLRNIAGRMQDHSLKFIYFDSDGVLYGVYEETKLEKYNRLQKELKNANT